MERWLDLDGAWTLGVIDDRKVPEKDLTSYTPDVDGMQTFAATVPGNYELDMEKAGAIPNLYFDDNLKIAHEMEYNHVYYSKKFTLDEVKPNLELVFEGIDTIADIYLNGVKLGAVRNMHLHHRFPVSSILQKGENEILVHIKPIAIEARKIDDPFYTFALTFNYESINFRKSAYMFGWDIFPRIVSMGLWRSVYLEEKPEVGIKQAYLWTRGVDLEQNAAMVELFWELDLGHEHTRDFTVVLDANCGESNIHAESHIWGKTGKIRNITVENAKFWWPKNAGEQNLYDVTVSLMQNGKKVAEKKFTFGLRTLELIHSDTEDENYNGQFVFKVNGQNIFVMGTNWVPLDSFPSQGRAKLDRAFDLVREVGCNMIRIWGGGYYEDEHLFDLCDREGVLIWQDFMMGCGQYPQNEDFQAQMHEECSEIIRRFRQHPALAIWAGDNECDVACNWNGNLVNPNHNVLTREVLPYEVRMNDTCREFLPSSPYVSARAWDEADSFDKENIPEKHLWGPRDYFKGDFYTKTVAHFASETGYHGCPAVESIKKFIREDRLWPMEGNESWILHASSPAMDADDSYVKRNQLMVNQIKVLFGVECDNLEEFSFLSQFSQAEAMKFFVERFRTGKWKRTGIIWWNVLDGCPQFSDAFVDYYFNKKKVFDYVKRSQQPVCIMVSEERNQFCLVNDTNKDVTVEWKILTSDGRTVRTGTTDCEKFGRIDIMNVDKSLTDMYRMEWTVGGTSGFNHYTVIEGAIDKDVYAASAKRNGLY